MTRKEIAPGVFISYQENPKLIQEAEQVVTPIAAKVAYVVRQPQSRMHTCHWPDCDQQVPPAMWGCFAHWRQIPRTLQRKLWNAYEIGQEVDMSPSEAYLAVADEIQRYIQEHLL